MVFARVWKVQQPGQQVCLVGIHAGLLVMARACLLRCASCGPGIHGLCIAGVHAVQKGLAPRIFEYLFQRVAEEEHDAHRVSLKCQ